jgi:hypothetical protein
MFVCCEVKEVAERHQRVKKDPNLEGAADEAGSDAGLLYLVTVEQCEEDGDLFRQTTRSSIKPLVEDDRAEAKKMLATYGALEQTGPEDTKAKPLAQAPLPKALMNKPELPENQGSTNAEVAELTPTTKAAAKKRPSKPKKDATPVTILDPKKIKAGSPFGSLCFSVFAL